MPVQALLYDLDGTLIDSMRLHDRSWELWHARQGLPFDIEGFFHATAGRSGPEIMTELFPGRSAAEILSLCDEKEQLYRDLALQQLQPIAGAQDLLARCHAAGLRQAVCTAGPTKNVEVAYRLFNFDRHVGTMVNPEQGFRGKPHPDLFFEAARRLGVEPANCVVFEDAPLGIEAAQRAGMRAVAVTSSLPAAAFTRYDNLICAVPDLHGFDVATLGPIH
jgi:beta-phosphoglucomutase